MFLVIQNTSLPGMTPLAMLKGVQLMFYYNKLGDFGEIKHACVVRWVTHGQVVKLLRIVPNKNCCPRR